MLGRVLIVAIAAILVTAGPAGATQRFASPAGAGSCATAAAPCSYPTAMLGATSGDEIILAAGDYGSELSPIAADIYSYDALNVHGVAGQPRPRIFSSATYSLGLYNAASVVRHLEVHRTTTSAGVAFDAYASTIDDIVVTSPGGASAAACRLSGAAIVMRNALCQSRNETGGFGILVSDAVDGAKSVTLRNVTAIATGAGATALGAFASGTRNATVTAVNSIFEGDVDVYAHESAPADAAVSVTYSQLHTIQQDPGAEITQDATSVYAYPLFLDFPGGNFHQDAASPTVDKGVDDPANGATDWDGDPRTWGIHTDIGADEYVAAALPPVPVPVPEPAPGPTSGPAPAPVPAPITTPTTPAAESKALKAGDVVVLPSARACVSRRSFRIRLRAPKGVTLQRATVLVNGKRSRSVTGKALTAPVDLRGLPKGRFTVKVTVVTTTGRKVTATRAYRTCALKRR